MLRRSCWEVIDSSSTAYTEVVTKLNNRDTADLTKAAREYWSQLVTRVHQALHFGWVHGATADGENPAKTVTLPFKLKKAEAFLVRAAVDCGWTIGSRYRKMKSERAA
jgi:hypothetical protein